MLLKRLTLVGFKSFADRTRLEFDAGVNVVVGPNGAGKSNLLDAIAWVMGTQATKWLRTERMEDVVFAGTATRPALSRAEVSLTFENADGFLPVDLNEVTISRRLYRDGTSEYELNGITCRLLDIQELLSDGGVGRHQHVLVSQGQIGQILTAGPEELRAVIEEAAGVTKHRNRRDRAIRRLEHTEVDVARLNDILVQQRRQLRPLKRQANAAARYDEVKSLARALRLWLGGRELAALRKRRSAAEAEQGDLEATLAEDRSELASLRERLEGLREEAGAVGRELERDTAAAARLETVAERLRRIGLVALERRRSLETRIAGAGARRSDLDAERSEVVAGIEGAAAAESEAIDAADRGETALRALEDEERALAEQIQLPTEGAIATMRGDLRALEAADDRDQRELVAASSRRESVADRVAGERTEIEQLGAEIRQTDERVTPAQADYEVLSAERRDAQVRLETDEEAIAEARLSVAGSQARIDALEAAMDGLADEEASARAEANDGISGRLIQLLDVPAEVAPAVDAALGDDRHGLLASNMSAVGDVVALLKSEGLGGVGFLSPPVKSETPARGPAAEFGAEALVDRLGTAADRDVAAALLGDVVLVEGWSAGWSLVERYPELRAATPEGDLIWRHGMHVAQPDGAGPAALEAARVALEIGERELARLESHRLTTRRAFEALRERERVALESLEALETRLAGHAEALGILQRQATEGEAELARLDARIGALREGATHRDDRLAQLRSRLAEFEGEEGLRQAAWEALNDRREEVARRRDDARHTREVAAAEVATAAERRSMFEGRLADIDAELVDVLEIPQSDPRIEQLSAVETAAGGAVDLVREHIASLRDRQRFTRDNAGTAHRDLATAEQRVEELQEAIAAAVERTAVLAVEATEARVRDEAVGEMLRREADASEEEALAAGRPEIDDDVDETSFLASLEADVRRMGPINPLAAAEYDELSAQVELLESELADLEASRRDLQEVIVALDDEMAALFRAAFDEIGGLYEENFALVFPGGRGRLRMSNPDRPLETGVEVDAQPMGKKVGRLALLSGGERSLAALAFLFAVFRARPSPFYVLDEVEAALDDANLARFLRLVDTLRKSAQLVIITHQQQTMEAADILYGVTMEPGASSIVIAKRMAPVTA